MMKLSARHLASLIGVFAGCQLALPVLANTCRWDSAPGPVSYQVNLGTVYVPRDASINSIIGVADQFVTSNRPGPTIICTNDGSVTLDFNAINIAPFDHHRGTFGNGGVDDRIFATNIPGIGARVTLEAGFDGQSGNSFVPIGGSPVVPFDAQLSRRMVTPFTLSRLRSLVTLVKTGPIAPGPHMVNRHMFDGYFSNIGKGFGYNLNATVIQSQCAVGANPVSVDPVPLGTWQVGDFNSPDYATTPVPFTITLTRCEADPTNANQANAYIRLDGANGSLPEGDGRNGVFSLGNGSGARGVGIQILRGDGITPVPLGTDVFFGSIENARDKTLGFTARFYKTGSVVSPGSANGALSFTLSFQ
ncbi:type 1 fimbrial protein [Pseudomonas sp. R3-56]|uniref:fimbrial protein n=1 Tax=Pseudomonas sp. R3-56 TaxID=2817401 RepID=UPI003DA9217E